MKKIFLTLICTFTLFAQKLIVLEPSAVEILLALGAKDDILAIAKPSTLDIYPLELSKNLKSVGTYIRPNIEKIVSLKPDIVIAGHHSINVENDLKNFNIKTLQMKANSLNEMRENIKTLAKLVNKEKKGDELILQFNKELEQIKNPKLFDKKVMFVFTSNPLMLFCGNNLANDLILNLKMQNVCDKAEPTLIVNPEYILSKNPDYIIYMGNDDSIFLQNQFLKYTKAYKNNKIIKISSSKLLRASPRIIGVLKELEEKLLKK